MGLHIATARVTAPDAAPGEIARSELVNLIVSSACRHVFVQAGAGYGKTTLLSQVLRQFGKTVWLTLDGEADVYAFLSILTHAINQAFSAHEFKVSEYLPFEESAHFTTMLANGLISSLEELNTDLNVFLEDLHTISDRGIRLLIACMLKCSPKCIRFFLSSRDEPWLELIALRARGAILEITQREMAFTRVEADQVLGLADEKLYILTEGWPLAVGSLRVLMDRGVALKDLAAQGSEALYSYIFYECAGSLPEQTAGFLAASSCLEELYPPMLDAVLNRKDTRDMLDDLVRHSIFTVKTSDGKYRYHALFREYLEKGVDPKERVRFQHSAAQWYAEAREYGAAAQYAIRISDWEMLVKIILSSYSDSIKNGDFSELRAWFHAISEAGYPESTELLAAKGAYLSSIGNFIAAKDCLDRAIPNLLEGEDTLYLEAMAHKARVLRNCESFEASNRLLDALILERAGFVGERAYFIVIEKIYNLAWDSRLQEAFTLTERAMDACAQAGDVRVRHWYERYLSVLYYLAGRMKDSVYYYEKSLAIPEEELRLLCRHSTEIYVAKAYQMLGRREEAVLMIAKELQRLKSAGLYEELWLGYLFAAEIHYQNISIDNFNGAGKTFETVVKYFTLADEYACMFRKTETQRDWANMQRRVYSLMFPSEPVEQAIREIFQNLGRVSDHFKTVALGRLYHYFGTVSDFIRAAECARMSIEIGERAGMMMIATMAYGILARFSIGSGDTALQKSIELTRRFLILCEQNGIYEYFRMRKAYDPVLAFAFEHKIEPEITARLMAFCGYQQEKAFVQTMGGFSVYSAADVCQPVKLRTKKERELLAYLLDAGERGATKEQIGQALWYDSGTEDVKKLIGVNLAQLKRDLIQTGINELIENVNNHYRIVRNGIRVDVDEFDEAARVFRETGSEGAAQKIASLYKGEYLAEFEAFWAVGKRLELDAVYREALRRLHLGEGK